MNISSKILENLNTPLFEKASIDWNNYLTSDEVKRFLDKDDKIESAENIIYSKNFNSRFADFKKSGWTKQELVKDLERYYTFGHLNEDAFDLWKSQMDNLSSELLNRNLDKLYNAVLNYKDNEVKSNKMFNLLKKINYLENKLGIPHKKLGRILH